MQCYSIFNIADLVDKDDGELPEVAASLEPGQAERANEMGAHQEDEEQGEEFRHRPTLCPISNSDANCRRSLISRERQIRSRAPVATTGPVGAPVGEPP